MKVYVVIDPMIDSECYGGEIIGIFSDENKVKELVEKRDNQAKEYRDSRAICQKCPYYDIMVDERWNFDLPDCYHSKLTFGGAFGLAKRTCCKGNFKDYDISPLIVIEYELDEQIKEIFDVKSEE